jgi:glycosyltransferase involved in cell wall biosynthesis
LKIAVVAPTYLPARRANTIQVMKMSQAFVLLGHEVQLVVPGYSTDNVSKALPDWDILAHQYGLKVEFPVEWLPVRANLRRYDFGYLAVRWARGWRADLLYTRLPQAAAVASTLGIATIYEVHDLPQGALGPKLLQRFLKGSGARRLVLITRALAGDLSGRFGVPAEPPFTIIAPDGVDLDRYQDLPDPAEARRRLNLPFTGFAAGYTGHLYPGRGAELILEIASRMPEFNFLLVGGEVKDVDRLQREAAEAEPSNVLLTGFIPNAELPLYQAASDVLLMPYQRRVAASSGGDIARYLSPMKLFEYLASGRPILSSDLPVLREILNPDNAVLLAPDDVDAWVAAVRSLQADPERRTALGRRARQDAAGYTWEARAERILEGL